MTQTCDPAAVRFGPFLYEPINGRLLRAAHELGAPPRALAILGCLLRQPGLLVTKQHLLDEVWKDAFVTDTSLSSARGDASTAGLGLPGQPPPAIELEVVIQWALEVRQQAPVAPRPLPVVR
jgi:hypothetical protein